MADRKFIRIPAKDLPDLFYIPNDINNPQNGGKNVYFVRYRVTSEDGTLYSTWSPKFETKSLVEQNDIDLNGSDLYSVSRGSGFPKILSVTWNVNDLLKTNKLFVGKFHIYVRFHNNGTLAEEPWLFMQEITSTSFSTIVPSGSNKIDVAVLIPTYRGLDAGTVMPNAPDVLYPESVLFVDRH